MKREFDQYNISDLRKLPIDELNKFPTDQLNRIAKNLLATGVLTEANRTHLRDSVQRTDDKKVFDAASNKSLTTNAPTCRPPSNNSNP